MIKLPITEQRIKKMKRRLRKKLHVGEFQQLHFKIYVQFKKSFEFDDQGYDDFMDDMIDLIESRNLSLFGMGGLCPIDKTDAVIAKFRDFPHKTTAEDRNAVVEWLFERDEILSVQASEIFDGWYGPYPDDDE